MTERTTGRGGSIDRTLGEHSELVSGVVIGGLTSFGVWYLVTGDDAAGSVGLSASVTGVAAALIVYTYAQRRARASANGLHLVVVAVAALLLALYAFVWAPGHPAVHAIVWVVAALALLVAVARVEHRTAAPIANDPDETRGPLDTFFEDREAGSRGQEGETDRSGADGGDAESSADGEPIGEQDDTGDRGSD